MAEGERKPKKWPVVLVAIPGWPSQDPGRRMLYHVRPSMQKAAKMAKRLKRQLPEFEWSTDQMTIAEANAMKRAPFIVENALGRFRCHWSGRAWVAQRIETEGAS